MMLAEPGLVIAAMVKQADEVEVVLQCKRRVDARLVKRSEKDAKAQPRCHGDLLWAIHRLPACRKGQERAGKGRKAQERELGHCALHDQPLLRMLCFRGGISIGPEDWGN